MLRVRVLGELALELDEVPVDPPQSRRARSVLGLLALDRRSHSRSQLAAALWPDVLDESARTSLRSALSALRRSLGPDADRYLVATRERVGLADDVWTDATAFDQLSGDGRLQEALDLYRGDVLWGLDDDWVLTARDGWRERVARVHDRLAAEAEAAGDGPAALAHTRRMVALDPLAEESQRALIRRLARTGERAAAIAAYTRYAERLRTELRIVPSAETRALVGELRRADAEPDGETVEASAAVPGAAWERRIPLPAGLARDEGALVDRQAELRLLEDAWRGARAGRLGVVLVAGEPGIGKTRLVSEFCRHAHADGATVLLGCSYEEGLLPYQPFAEVLRQCVSAAAADALRM